MVVAECLHGVAVVEYPSVGSHDGRAVDRLGVVGVVSRSLGAAGPESGPSHEAGFVQIAAAAEV